MDPLQTGGSKKDRRGGGGEKEASSASVLSYPRDSINAKSSDFIMIHRADATAPRFEKSREKMRLETNASHPARLPLSLSLFLSPV
jgi:hypothetical protein